jgi:hypothetical protein
VETLRFLIRQPYDLDEVGLCVRVDDDANNIYDVMVMIMIDSEY